jgi:hypothetical protein
MSSSFAVGFDAVFADVGVGCCEARRRLLE